MPFSIIQKIVHTTFINILFMHVTTLTHAEISFSDNPTALPMSQGEYVITQDLGVTTGNNLFHSFHHFSLNSGETVTFSGANHIENVVSRVTGGSVSNINGTIKNTISGAETYLINPAGIVFGAGARLDVQGGFHAATATSLKFNDGSEFHTALTQNSRFSSASPTEFGLLGNGDINLQNNAILEVNQGKALHLQANNISLQPGARLHSFAQGNATGAEVRLQAMQALRIDGHNDGETDNDSILSHASSRGAAGDILLHGNSVTINDANITANTSALGRGADIEIEAKTVSFDDTFVFLNSESFEADAGRSGDMRVHADTITLTGETVLNAGVMGSSDGSNITLQASGDIILDGYSHIYADTFLGTGNGGVVRLKGNNIFLNNGGFIDTTTKNIGNAGQIEIEAKNTLFMGGDNIGDDTPAEGKPSMIASGTFPLVEGTTGLEEIGKGGKISIKARDLVMRDGAIIFNSSLSVLDGSISGDAGEVNIDVSDSIHISGVNPYGELDKSFASGIYLSSSGIGAGSGGQLNLAANSLTLKDGAMIVSSTNSASSGGAIALNISDTLHISGDATDIPLREPAGAQLRYLARFSGEQYNQATSGIYSNTKASHLAPSTANNASGGTISIYAGAIELHDQAMISSSSSGVGEAGSLAIKTKTLKLSEGASISSNSTLQNTFSFTDTEQRDAQFLLIGDVLEVADVGDGRHGYYVQTAGDIQRVAYTNSATDVNAMYALPQQESMGGGDIIEVNGQAYIYTDNRDLDFAWVAFDRNQTTVTLPNMEALQRSTGWFNVASGKMPTYPSGTHILVTDAGNGKPATFVYKHAPDVGNIGFMFGETLRIKHFQINNRTELQQLQNELSLTSGSTAHLTQADGTKARFFYQGEQWIELHLPQPVSDLSTALSNFQAARPGYVSELSTGQFVSVGDAWLPIHNSYRVTDLAKRDALSAQAGDLVSVANIGKGSYELFYYHDGTWHPRIHGGNAGQITLNVQDNITLDNDSHITTAAFSAGGGGIDIHSGGILQASQSQITTSVQEGAGNGGDLNIESNFLVQSQASVIARAVEGNGGNIQIQSKGIFQFGKPSENPIDASSQFGVSGNVKLTTPEESVSGSVFIVNGQFIKSTQLSLNQCDTPNQIGDISRFMYETQHSGSPKSPESFQE